MESSADNLFNSECKKDCSYNIIFIKLIITPTPHIYIYIRNMNRRTYIWPTVRNYRPTRTIMEMAVKKPLASSTKASPNKTTTIKSASPNNTIKDYSTTLPQKMNSISKTDNRILEATTQNESDEKIITDVKGTINNSKPLPEINWYTSWYGLGSRPFDKKVQDILVQVIEPKDIEIKPDGLIYLPEIKYRRILNKAFGAGGWGLVPRSETIVTPNLVTREYGLICHGQLVSVARGEQDYFNETGIPTATEGCKSNALMRCCKDLGIGSELWDPIFIKSFKEQYCIEKFVEHITTKKKKKIWLRKDRKVEYPYK